MLSNIKIRLLFFQNKDDAKFLLDWGVLNSSKVRLVRGSRVDLKSFKYNSEPEDKIIITFVARLLLEKGIGEFIEASRLLYKKGLDAEFWVVGDRDSDNPKSVSRQQIERGRICQILSFLDFNKMWLSYIVDQI